MTSDRSSLNLARDAYVFTSGPTHARRRTLRLRVIACGSVACSTGLGMISLRNFVFGASTPWKRIRCNRGRGIRAARRCMNSSGSRFF